MNNAKNHYIFNGLRPDIAIPEEEGVVVRFWIAYRKLLKAFKKELKDDTVRYDLKRLVPELPLPYDRAIELLDYKFNRLASNDKNVEKLNKAISYLEDKDITSALRTVLRSK